MLYRFLSIKFGNILRARDNRLLFLAKGILKLLILITPRHKNKLLVRHLKVSSLPIAALDESDNLPEIEILIAAASKELDFIHFVIESAVCNSANPISLVTIVVPDKEIVNFKSVIAEIPDFGVPIKILEESKLVEKGLSDKIENRFGSRAGWAKAEFIKMEFVTKSKAKGVLVIDADTILLHNHVWLNGDLSQVISPVQEYHPVYFNLYKHLRLPLQEDQISFMSHYMLFQPIVYRAAFSAISKSDSQDLFDAIAEFVPLEENSPFCICYELYAHFLLDAYPTSVRLEKWSNRAISRSKILELEDLRKVRDKYYAYTSISCHQYLN